MPPCPLKLPPWAPESKPKLLLLPGDAPLLLIHQDDGERVCSRVPAGLGPAPGSCPPGKSGVLCEVHDEDLLGVELVAVGILVVVVEPELVEHLLLLVDSVVLPDITVFVSSIGNMLLVVVDDDIVVVDDGVVLVDDVDVLLRPDLVPLADIN